MQYDLTKKSFENINKNIIQNLKSFSYKDNKNGIEINQALKAISRYNNLELTSLNLEFLPSLNTNTVEILESLLAILKNKTDLKEFKFPLFELIINKFTDNDDEYKKKINLVNDLLKSLSKNKNLQVLELISADHIYRMDEDLINNITVIDSCNRLLLNSELKQLAIPLCTLHHHKDYQQKMIKIISSKSNLEKLELVIPNIKNKLNLDFYDLKNLENLNILFDIDSNSDNNENLDKVTLPLTLKTLKLDTRDKIKKQIVNSFIKPLSKCSSLKTLFVSSNFLKKTDLSKLENLDSIEIGCQLDQEYYADKIIPRLPSNLKEIKIEDISAFDLNNTVKILSKLKKLKDLEINKCISYDEIYDNSSDSDKSEESNKNLTSMEVENKPDNEKKTIFNLDLSELTNLENLSTKIRYYNYKANIITDRIIINAHENLKQLNINIHDEKLIDTQSLKKLKAKIIYTNKN